ncbi:hypothetical protein [Sphingomonas aracearum]|uniref:hypothetical protein n=1 Tax=Sphingomonas aracearum TaxID=2283317 RepID=UPI001C68A054|nr:hypothetical protein [Sphingomonas aracearum]
MIGALANTPDLHAAARDAMREALARMDAGRPVLVVSHFDADGLAAAAVLVRALAAAGRRVEPLVLGKGETPWDAAVTERLRERAPGGVILADLGTRADPVLPGCATLVIDHHVPTGTPEGAITLSGNGLSPEPTTALLAWWAAGALGDVGDLLWLAAIGLIGDMEEGRAFPELMQAQARWGKTALREAVVLVNAPGARPPPTPGRRCVCCCGRTGPRRSPRAPTRTPWRCTPPAPRCARRWRRPNASPRRCAATWR